MGIPPVAGTKKILLFLLRVLRIFSLIGWISKCDFWNQEQILHRHRSPDLKLDPDLELKSGLVVPKKLHILFGDFERKNPKNILGFF